MTSSTISKTQAPEHFTSTSQDLGKINSERMTNKTETSTVKSTDLMGKKNSEREYHYWLEQKLSQRSYVSGYKGF